MIFSFYGILTPHYSTTLFLFLPIEAEIQEKFSIWEQKSAHTVMCVRISTSVIKKQQRVPGDDVAAILEFQSVFFQHRDHIDAVALNAGVHPFRKTAGLAV